MNDLKIKFDNQRITNHGGYELFDRFANRSLKLFKILDRTVTITKRQSTYDVAHLNYSMIMANTIFPFRISQLDHIKNDDYLKCKFDMTH